MARIGTNFDGLYPIGSRVILNNNSPYKYQEEGIGIIKEIVPSSDHIYLVTWEGGSRNQYRHSDLLLKENEMVRKVIEKGNLVEVISRAEIFPEMEDKAVELGATKFNKAYIPAEKEEGDVIGVDDGYVLVDFKGNEVLIDISCLSAKIRKDDVKFLVRYPNSTLEEFTKEEAVVKRLEQLHEAGAIKPGDVLKMYNVSGYKETKIKINVFFS